MSGRAIPPPRRQTAEAHLKEGFALLEKYDLYKAAKGAHSATLDRVLADLGSDPHAPEVAAAFQALAEAKRLMGAKGSLDPTRIILGDYFTGLAVKLVLPLRSKPLMDAVCGQLDEIGRKAENPLYRLSEREFQKQIDGLCRGYLEGKHGQQTDTGALEPGGPGRAH